MHEEVKSESKQEQLKQEYDDGEDADLSTLYSPASSSQPQIENVALVTLERECQPSLR